jgi:hypothetical protein
MSKRSLSMVIHFGGLKDPRIDRTKRHLLVDIVCLSYEIRGQASFPAY